MYLKLGMFSIENVPKVNVSLESCASQVEDILDRGYVFLEFCVSHVGIFFDRECSQSEYIFGVLCIMNRGYSQSECIFRVL